MLSKQYTYGLEDIKSIANDLLPQFNSKVILFNGEIGAGKTTLIKALLEVMGSKDDVTSPTFSIVNEYETASENVYHFDFYRIENIEEAYNFGIEDYFFSDNWLFIEWAERVEGLIPEDCCVIDITMLDVNKRFLKFITNTNKLTKNANAIS